MNNGKIPDPYTILGYCSGVALSAVLVVGNCFGSAIRNFNTSGVVGICNGVDDPLTESEKEQRRLDKPFKYIPKLEPLYFIGNLGLDPDSGELYEVAKEIAKYDHIRLKGGRGGGKSESVAQVLILLSRVEKTRILCTREIQLSMRDSVHKMLVDWIDIMELKEEFIINNHNIVNKLTGTEFIFMGMKTAVDTDSLKSLKGVKYVWYEEAQTATYKSLEKLDPTIRMEGRKLIYSYNPDTDRDSVTTFFAGKKKVLTIHINYYENPFCPSVLLSQAEEMKELDYDRYLHVWEGQPIPEDSSLVVLPLSWLKQCVDLHKRIQYGDLPGIEKANDMVYELNDYTPSAGFDVAEGKTDAHDKNALAIRCGPVVTHVEEWQIDEVYESVKKINNRHKGLKFTRLYYDATAVGVAAKSEFARINNEEYKLPYKVIGFKGSTKPQGSDVIFDGSRKSAITNAQMFANSKSQSWWNIRLKLENSMRLISGRKIDRKDNYLSFSSDIDDLDGLLLELAQATFDEDSGKIRIDKAPGMRKVLIDGKEKDRKSPNRADSVVYSFVGDMKKGLRAHRPGRKKTVKVG